MLLWESLMAFTPASLVVGHDALWDWGSRMWGCENFSNGTRFLNVRWAQVSSQSNWMSSEHRLAHSQTWWLGCIGGASWGCITLFQTSFGSEQATGSATCVHSDEACWGCFSSGLREYIQSFPLLNTMFTYRKQTKYFPAIIPQHVTIKLVFMWILLFRMLVFF